MGPRGPGRAGPRRARSARSAPRSPPGPWARPGAGPPPAPVPVPPPPRACAALGPRGGVGLARPPPRPAAVPGSLTEPVGSALLAGTRSQCSAARVCPVCVLFCFYFISFCFILFHFISFYFILFYFFPVAQPWFVSAAPAPLSPRQGRARPPRGRRHRVAAGLRAQRVQAVSASLPGRRREAGAGGVPAAAGQTVSRLARSAREACPASTPMDGCGARAVPGRRAACDASGAGRGGPRGLSCP